MKRSTKALLLSALVFPGAGHLYLKRFVTGTVLMLIAVIATGYLIVNAIHIAYSITDKIAAGDIPLDETAISHLLVQQSQQVSFLSSMSTYALCVAWLIGIVDSYRIGVALDRKPARAVRDKTSRRT